MNKYDDYFEKPGLSDRFHIAVCGPVDNYGHPVRRTKQSHPYNYDGFVLWKSANYNPHMDAGTIYSDRLPQWDWDKHNELCRKHFGNERQYWNDRDPKKIEAFLRDWNDNPHLILVLVMEYCNQSSGYPCWRFDFLDNTQPAPSGEASGSESLESLS